MKNIRYYIPGVLMILAAVLILAVPEVLVVFAATSVFLIGFLFLYVGHRMKTAEAEWKDLRQSVLYARVFRNPADTEVPYWF